MGYITFDYDDFDYTDHEVILELYDELVEADRLHLHRVVFDRYGVDLDHYYEIVFGEPPAHKREQKDDCRHGDPKPYEKKQDNKIFFDNDIVTKYNLEWDEDIVAPKVEALAVPMDCDEFQDASAIPRSPVTAATQVDNASSSSSEDFVIMTGNVHDLDECLHFNDCEDVPRSVATDDPSSKKLIDEKRKDPAITGTSTLESQGDLEDLLSSRKEPNNLSSTGDSIPVTVEGAQMMRRVKPSDETCRVKRAYNREHIRKFTRRSTSDKIRGLVLQTSGADTDAGALDVQLEHIKTVKGERVFSYRSHGKVVFVTRSQSAASELSTENSDEYVFGDHHILILDGDGNSRNIACGVARMFAKQDD